MKFVRNFLGWLNFIVWFALRQLGEVAQVAIAPDPDRLMIEKLSCCLLYPMPSPPNRPLEITLLVGAESPDLLEGLEVWLRLKLISNLQVRGLAQEHLCCPLPQPIEAVVATLAEPTAASSSLMESLTVQAPQARPAAIVSSGREEKSEEKSKVSERRLVKPAGSSTQASSTQRPPNWIGRVLQSLMAELSVVWLLFLGVFLVAVSSAVLAASKWESFTATGQYLVLLGYTVGFWWISRRAGKRANLRLTSQALALVTLLLVPANFWAMDGLKLLLVPANFWAMDGLSLGQALVQWLTVAIAAASLSAIAFSLLVPPSEPDFQPEQRLLFINSLGLSYLHWGWGWPAFPTIAVYIGTIGTAAATLYRRRLQARKFPKTPAQEIGRSSQSATSVDRSSAEISDSEPSSEPSSGPSSGSSSEPSSGSSSGPSSEPSSEKMPAAVTEALPPPKAWRQMGTAIVIYATVVLLLRALFIVKVEVTQLGLALGICGWLFARLPQPQRSPRSQAGAQKLTQAEVLNPFWQGLGAVLLFLGWLVSVGVEVPWQALAVSILAIDCFNRNLQQHWKRSDLAAIWLVGLQSIWLVWRLFPAELQRQAIQLGGQLTGTEDVWVLASTVLFAYVAATTALADWFYQQQHPKLAFFGEGLALALAAFLNCLSLENPTLRSLNLAICALIFGIVSVRRFIFPKQGRRARTVLVYLTHITGLLALGAIANCLWPHLTFVNWASLLLTMMVLEWGFSLLANGPGRATHPDSMLKQWSQSAWYSGLGLGLLGNYLLFGNLLLELQQPAFNPGTWRLLTLVLPLALTAMASRSHPPRRQLAGWLSVGAILLAQVLTFPIPGVRFIGLGFGAALMVPNTRYLRHLAAAAIAVGFGLSFLIVWLREGLLGLPPLSLSEWFLAGAIAVLNLWLLRTWLHQRGTPLARTYARAADYWALTLCCWELFVLTLHCLANYTVLSETGWNYLNASLLLLVAIFYRSWQNPSNSRVYLASWGIEIAIAEAIWLAHGTTLELAIANILTAVIVLLIGQKFSSQQQQLNLSSLQSLPLCYVLLGLLLRLSHFTSWTGGLTLVAGAVGIAVGRRNPQWRPLEYLSLAGISAGVYEMVVYQMAQAPGGAEADGLTILAGVAVALMLFYRLSVPWLSRNFRFRPNDIQVAAHLHWVLGSSLTVLAAAVTPVVQVNVPPPEVPANLAIPGLGLGLVLVGYALLQARHCPQLRIASGWVYAGIVEAVGLVFYARIIWPQLATLGAWSGAIAALIAILLYQLPWENWGWSAKPWQGSALVLPLATVLFTGAIANNVSLLAVAIFYIFLARIRGQIQLSYFSMALLTWLLWRQFYRWDLNDILWYVTPFGLSLLYMAQVDPKLQQPKQRQNRHALRNIGIGIICLPALLFHNHDKTGLLPGSIGLVTLFAGLLLRIRAFLWIGTFTFMGTVFYQLTILSNEHPLFKWAIGLCIGILCIWVAASFETRRSQIKTLVRSWLEELQDWQ